MKNWNHTPEQVIRKLAEATSSWRNTVEKVARHLEISEQTFHRWRNQYGARKADEAKRLKSSSAKTSG
jgi:transposase-like protein